MSSKLDRFHLLAALLYAVVGLGLGIYMAASQDHGQAVAHAHLLLVGFVMSFVYAVISRLWLSRPSTLLHGLQFGGHHLGTMVLVAGLFMLYGGRLSARVLEPVLASASILVLLALVLMVALVAGAASAPAPTPDAAPR